MSSLPLLLALLLVVLSPESMRLDLEGCLRLAREKNLGLRVSRLSLQRSELDWEKAWRERFMPRLDLQFTAPSVRQYTVQQVDPESGEIVLFPRESRTFEGGLSLLVPLPTDGTATVNYTGRRWEDFPREESDGYDPTYTSTLSFTFEQPILDKSSSPGIAMEQASLSRQIAKASYQEKEFDLDHRVAAVFLAAVRAQEQTKIDSIELEVAIQNADIGRRKFESGLLSKGDVLELELAEATSKAGFSSSAASRERALEDLLLVLGLPLSKSIDLVVPPPAPEPLISTRKAIVLAMERRRDVLSEKLQLSLVSSRLRQTREDQGPELNLVLGLDLVKRGSSLEPAWSGSQHDRSLRLGFSMPVLDFGRGSGEIRQAVISREQEVLGLEQTGRDVESEVRRTVRDVETAIERRKLLEIARQVAEENYDVAISRFESGSISSQRLLDAQLSFFRARTNLLSARIDLDLALRTLQKVTLARLDELEEDASAIE